LKERKFVTTASDLKDSFILWQRDLDGLTQTAGYASSKWSAGGSQLESCVSTTFTLVDNCSASDKKIYSVAFSGADITLSSGAPVATQVVRVAKMGAEQILLRSDGSISGGANAFSFGMKPGLAAMDRFHPLIIFGGGDKGKLEVSGNSFTQTVTSASAAASFAIGVVNLSVVDSSTPSLRLGATTSGSIFIPAGVPYYIFQGPLTLTFGSPAGSNPWSFGVAMP
jgi:hypothetical protein